MSQPDLFVPIGHFYSPVPDPEDAAKALGRLDSKPYPIPGIRLDDAGMLALWRAIEPLMVAAPFPDQPDPRFRYQYANGFYSYGDAAVYYAFIKHFAPKRVIEIGSGYSSALLLDVMEQERFDISATFIEPYPSILNTLLREGDNANVQVINQKVQDVPLSVFEELDRSDILFIDSSHVVKTGSDVCFELFDVLPTLKRGVLVHFHDTFAGFEYPYAWAVTENRGWNELYILRAFLTHNTDWEVVFFNDHFAKRFPKEVENSSSVFKRNPGGGLWLRKLSEASPI